MLTFQLANYLTEEKKSTIYKMRRPIILDLDRKTKEEKSKPKNTKRLFQPYKFSK